MSELSRSPASPPLLLVALGLIILSIVGAWFGSQNRGDLAATLAPVVEERALVFRAGEADALLVVDAADGAVVHSFAAGEGTFIRGMLRAIGRERRVGGVAEDVPLIVSAREDGSITVADDGTGIIYDLRAFGGGNMEAFARLLAAPAGADRLADKQSDRNLQTRTALPSP